jgi:cytochrome P450
LAERVRNFSVQDPTLVGEIYDLLGEMRDKCPVAYSEANDGFWAVTRYDDIAHCLKDADTFSTALGIAVPASEGRPNWIPITVAPEEHVLYRRDLNVSFAPGRVSDKEEEAGARARDYLRPIVERGTGDLISEFCGPFPCTTFLMMMGAPLADADQLLEWKSILVKGISDTEAREVMVSTVLPALTGYFDRLLDERLDANEPPDDFLTDLLRAHVGDRPYSREEMLRVCGFLTIAGLDTVTGTLARSLLFLARSPEHRAQLVADPTLIPNAVEELLRFWGIVSTGRLVTRDVVLGGKQIKEGEWLQLLTPSAGRDESAFEHADVVDFHRKHNRHLAFGAGIHRCLGSHLARMELKVALEAVVALMPNFRLDPNYVPKERLGQAFGVDELRIIVGEAR